MGKPRYSMADVERWESVRASVLSQLVHRLRTEPGHLAIARGRGLGSVANGAVSAGFACVARRSFGKALGWFAFACEARMCIYRQHLQGANIDQELLAAGNWQELLLAHVTNEMVIITQFGELFDLDIAARPEVRSSTDSMYIGRILKDLTEHRVADAMVVLDGRRPKVDRRFEGVVECLESIAKGDEGAFARSIAEASAKWESYMSRVSRGLPESVCFLTGAGLVKLAEHVWQRPVHVQDPNIPAELVDAVVPEPCEFSL